MGDDAAIAEAKHEAKAAGAPLQLMTQFLRTVSENRMEDALALAQTSELSGVRDNSKSSSISKHVRTLLTNKPTSSSSVDSKLT